MMIFRGLNAFASHNRATAKHVPTLCVGKDQRTHDGPVLGFCQFASYLPHLVHKTHVTLVISCKHKSTVGCRFHCTVLKKKKLCVKWKVWGAYLTNRYAFPDGDDRDSPKHKSGVKIRKGWSFFVWMEAPLRWRIPICQAIWHPHPHLFRWAWCSDTFSYGPSCCKATHPPIQGSDDPRWPHQSRYNKRVAIISHLTGGYGISTERAARCAPVHAGLLPYTQREPPPTWSSRPVIAGSWNGFPAIAEISP